MNEFIIHSVDDLKQVAEEILRLAKSKSIFLIYGSLGAGKTTMVKSLGTIINSEDSVTSPTFSLVNEYKTDLGILYHIDLYRLESLEEAIDIGIEEYLHQGKICLIEWPEIIESIVPPHHKIHIENLDDSIRKIIFS